MKERPVLFSTDMVQSILKGNKDRTRRTRGLERMNINTDDWRLYNGDYFIDKNGKLNQKFFNIHVHSDHGICHFGKPGDLLWVKEEHRIWRENNDWFCEFKDGTIVKRYYKSISLKTNFNLLKRKTIGNWQRSRFMPKDFTRIWLQITNIRVERLQSITHDDAIKEGICKLENSEYKNYLVKLKIKSWPTPYHSFQSLWEQINGSENWELNPWVWVIEFKRIEK